MNPSENASLHTTNPFATRYIRPGAIRFRFASPEPREESEGMARSVNSDRDRLTELVTMLRHAPRYRQSQIVGPHGSGKTTLLTNICQEMESSGAVILRFELRDSQRRLPWTQRETTAVQSAVEDDVWMVIDGFEQLSWWRRRLLRIYVVSKGLGLIVTAHRDIGLPTLWETRTDVALLQDVVNELQLHQKECDKVSSQDVQRSFERHQGNIREALLELYDRSQSRKRS